MGGRYLRSFECFFDEFKAFLKNFLRSDRIVGSLKQNNFLSALKGVVKQFCVMDRDKRVCFSVDEAYLSIVGQCFHSGSDVHSVDLQPCQGVHFALDACEDAGEETVEQAAAGLRQKFRT